MENPLNYHLHSGGAAGADITWDRIGQAFGIPKENMHHYRPEDYTSASPELKLEIDAAVERASEVLNRPSNFRGVDLVKRNWFQVANATAVFAIAYIVPRGGEDPKGHTNYTGRKIVSGGTGWAVEMAIQRKLPVYVFDQTTNQWYKFRYMDWDFYSYDGTPELHEDFAGIGSRELTPEGEDAIKDVYVKTFDHLNQ